MGFQGYVFSDYGGASQLYNFHKVASDDKAEAAKMAVTAGLDLKQPVRISILIWFNW